MKTATRIKKKKLQKKKIKMKRLKNNHQRRTKRQLKNLRRLIYHLKQRKNSSQRLSWIRLNLRRSKQMKKKKMKQRKKLKKKWRKKKKM